MTATGRAERPTNTRQAAQDTPRGRRAAISRHRAGLLVLAGAILLHVVLLLVIFPNLREDVVLRGNVRLFFHDSGRVLSGAVPYRDFLLEYPPGSLLFMAIPRLFAVGYLDYRALFFAEIAALDALMLVTLHAIARGARLSATRAMAIYTLAVILLGPLMDYRIDLAPALLTALAVLAWQRDRPALAAALLAAGVGTKLYPVLLLPPLALDLWYRDRRRLLPAALACAATLAIFISPAILAAVIAPEGLLHDIRFQTDRSLQVESIWATPPLLLHLLLRYPLEVAGRGRALVVFGPGNVLGSAGAPALILVALGAYFWWWRRLRAVRTVVSRRDDEEGRLSAGGVTSRRRAWERGRPARPGAEPGTSHKPALPDQAERRDARNATLLAGTAALVLAGAMLSKVLSPQYLIWALPVMALLPLRSRWAILALAAFLAALPLTQWIYPLHYGELVLLLSPAAVLILAARNALLVLALLALLVALTRMPDIRRQKPDKDTASC